MATMTGEEWRQSLKKIGARRPKDGDRWDRWIYRVPRDHPENAALVYEDKGIEVYYVMLSACVTERQRQNWLAQFTEKRWLSSAALKHR